MEVSVPFGHSSKFEGIEQLLILIESHMTHDSKQTIDPYQSHITIAQLDQRGSLIIIVETAIYCITNRY